MKFTHNFYDDLFKRTSSLQLANPVDSNITPTDAPLKYTVAGGDIYTSISTKLFTTPVFGDQIATANGQMPQSNPEPGMMFRLLDVD